MISGAAAGQTAGGSGFRVGDSKHISWFGRPGLHHRSGPRGCGGGPSTHTTRNHPHAHTTTLSPHHHQHRRHRRHHPRTHVYTHTHTHTCTRTRAHTPHCPVCQKEARQAQPRTPTRPTRSVTSARLQTWRCAGCPGRATSRSPRARRPQMVVCACLRVRTCNRAVVGTVPSWRSWCV